MGCFERGAISAERTSSPARKECLEGRGKINGLGEFDSQLWGGGGYDPVRHRFLQPAFAEKPDQEDHRVEYHGYGHLSVPGAEGLY